MRFNPATYTVTEGVDSNAVITLETIGAHTDVINVTVNASNGNATRGCIYATFAYQFSRFVPCACNANLFDILSFVTGIIGDY